MLEFLPAPLVGAIASLLMLLNILIWVPILLLVSFIKLLLPFKRVRLLIDLLLLRIAEAWIDGNSGWMRLTQRLDWDVTGICDLNPRQWYLVVCNHQSWVDILVLQHVLNRRYRSTDSHHSYVKIWRTTVTASRLGRAVRYEMKL